MRRITHAAAVAVLFSGTAVACIAPLPALSAAGDAAAGKHAFGRCAACHSTLPGRNGIGPSLAGVVGRKAGSIDGFNYSPALKKAGISWDEATLDKFLLNPAGYVHGTKMFVGLQKATDRRDVITYLKELSR
jgi:cytochrome c